MRLIVYQCDARPCPERVEVRAKVPAPTGWVEVQVHSVYYHRPVEAGTMPSGLMPPFVLCPEHSKAFLDNFKRPREPEGWSDDGAPRRLPR